MIYNYCMIGILSEIFGTIHYYMMCSVIDMTNIYFGDSVVYFVLAVVCYSLLVMKHDEMKIGYKLFSPFTVCSLVFVTYNPIVQWTFHKFSLMGDECIIETFMLCPLFAVIAYVLACNCQSIKMPLIKRVVIMGLALLIVFAGYSAYLTNMMVESVSPYKIKPEAVEVADAVLEVSGGEPSTLYIFTPPYEVPDSDVVGGTIYAGIPQYTSSIQVIEMATSNGHWQDYYLSDLTPEGISSEEYIRGYMEETFEEFNLDYFALPINEIVDNKMHNIGYERVGEGGGYYIYAQHNQA